MLDYSGCCIESDSTLKMFFEFGRNERFPTIYAPNRTPVTVDVLDSGFIFAAVILGISFFISVISTRAQENLYLYTRVTVSIILGAIILLANFGQEWEVGHIQTRTPYKAGTGAEITADISVKIGLRSVNVTLKSVGDLPSVLRTEQIDYNERFHWTWDQGRFGFGPYAGLIQREFREAQYRGAPLPILWIVDYFVIDGEGFRHGRFYRTAGWYTHIAMWTAFPCWILANLFFRSVIRYGGYCMAIAGGLQLTANLLWLVIRNPNALEIPFEDATIVTHFGPTYWLTFSSGIICIAICIAIVICERLCNDNLHIFFGVDPLTTSDEKYVTEEEYNFLQGNPHANRNDELPLIEMRAGTQPRERTKTILVHVRKNTRSVLKANTRNTTTDAIYGNLQTLEEEPSTSQQNHDDDDEHNYGNLETTQLPQLPARPPPLPKKKY